MKKLIIVFAAFVAGAVMVSCDKFPAKTDEAPGEEIVLNVDDRFDAEVTTKGTKIESVPSTLYWGRTTGSAGSEANITGPTTATGVTSSIATGLYQTATPTTYNWYVANQTFTIAAGGTTIAIANNTTDVIAARVSSSASSVSIQLNHVFACLGTLTMNTQTGYSITVNSWHITSSGANTGTKGTYSITSGAWSSTTAANEDVTSGSNNFYIPGSYTITCNYTLTKGAYSQTFTKSASVDLVRGKTNNITGTATGGSASEITLSVSVEAWGTNNMTPSFS